MTKRWDKSNQPWLWVEEEKDLTQDNLESSYRLNSKQHSTCRKNCRSNPRCLTGFGEASWSQPITQDYLELRRTPGTFAGLKNLGNTCYINCFLQLWFHNRPLCEALYLWDGFKDPSEPSKVANYELKHDDCEPVSSIAHLQVLLAEMEFGSQKYCDPEGFCKSLCIDVELQQDAQEFGKLFMTCLENTFGNAENEATKNVIKSQFRGQYSYATTCSQCLNVSRHQSYFYELELNIKKTILDSLSEFVQDSKLHGDDKYFCGVCFKKQDATQCIELNTLPQVLQLQLLRYYFDMASASKKKITQSIAFPDVLDMSQYIGKPEGTEIYTLQAVLMHGGTSADSGHYYAHINTQDGWHIFDDIAVRKQKQLSLINDEPLTKNGEKKVPKIKGFRSSSAAYMLVYRKQNADEKTVMTQELTDTEANSESNPSSPSIKSDNLVKNAEIIENPIEANNGKLENENNGQISSIKTEETEAPEPMETTDISCLKPDHERQKQFEKLPNYLKKIVEKRNEKFAESIQSQVNEYEDKILHQNFIKTFFEIITPEENESSEFIHWNAIRNLTKFVTIPLDNLPLLCVHDALDVNKYKDYKLVSSRAVECYISRFGGGPRIPFSSLCRICVSKCAAGIRSQAALKADVKLVSQYLKQSVTINERGFWVGKKSIKNWWTQIDPQVSEIGVMEIDECNRGEIREFNSDITCPHNGLQHAEGGRRLVGKSCWDLFKKYFPKCKEFPMAAKPCFLCKNDAKATQECQRLKARNENDVLQSLVNEKREVTGNVFYIISLTFVTAWRRYVRSATLQVLKDRPSASSAFQSLLCSAHNLLIFDPSSDIERTFNLMPDEWCILKQLYGLTNEIRVELSDSISYSVDMCKDCIAELECQEDSYFGAKMYVYKVANEVDEESLVQAEGAELEAKKLGQKRKQPTQQFNSIPAKKPAAEWIRRSARSKVPKDDIISFRINKHTTLKQLKIMICNKLLVLPCDQHLSLDGNDLDDLKVSLGLTDEEATFIKLRVPPCSTLRLLADEPSPELEAFTDSAPTEPEPGFKGTGLGGC